jgi:hypothetical protein
MNLGWKSMEFMGKSPGNGGNIMGTSGKIQKINGGL